MNVLQFDWNIQGHLAWLKQELELRQEQDTKLRQDLHNALLDCENDRKYFTTELTKREDLIQQLTNEYQHPERDVDTSTFSIEVCFEVSSSIQIMKILLLG